MKTFQTDPEGHSSFGVTLNSIESCLEDDIAFFNVKIRVRRQDLPAVIPSEADVRTKGFVFGTEVVGIVG